MTDEEPEPLVPSYDGKNRSLSFDGANDYASTGTAAFPVADGPQTIIAWVRPTRVASESVDAGTGAEDRQAVVTLRKDSESGVVLGLRRGVFEAWSVFSGRTYARASTPAMLGVWQHVAYSYDRSMHRIFIDGRQLDAGSFEPNNRTPTTAWLGTLDGVRNPFVGELDHVSVYDIALDPSAIGVLALRGRMSANAVLPVSGLVLDLGFDEVSGTKGFVLSGQHNDAVLGDGIAEHMRDRLIDGLFDH